MVSLRDKGLLCRVGNRYFATSVMENLLFSGLVDIAKVEPAALFEYWLWFFRESLHLSEKKSQTSDKVELQRASLALQRSLKNMDGDQAQVAFDRLVRAVFDGCYNSFLGQTDLVLRRVMRNQLALGFKDLVKSEQNAGTVANAAASVAKFRCDSAVFRQIFKSEAEPHQPKQKAQERFAVGTSPANLVEVVLRHPLYFEAIYELRLITEKQAATQAASNASEEQLATLQVHLDEMAFVAETSPTDYSELDTMLHSLIADCAQNPVFVLVDKALSPVFSPVTNQWLSKHRKMRSDQSQIHLQHMQIVEAITERNKTYAQNAMDEHLAYVLRNLRFLREQERLKEIATARQLLR
jgi:DNA-binding GntR family transcriptional regulator